MAAPVGPVSAAQAIGEYLQSPDDLVKVSTFRKKLEKEKASIDTRLKIGVKEQLQATKLGLKKFLSTRENVQAIKDEMMAIEKECEDPSVRVATFDQISRVSGIINDITEFLLKCVGFHGPSKFRNHRRNGQQSPCYGHPTG
jgi:hypothetical protein